jgi:hypothetical protein
LRVALLQHGLQLLRVPADVGSVGRGHALWRSLRLSTRGDCWASAAAGAAGAAACGYRSYWRRGAALACWAAGSLARWAVGAPKRLTMAGVG